MRRVAAILTAFMTMNSYAFNGSETRWGITEKVDEFTDKKTVTALVFAEGGIRQGFMMLTCYAEGFEGKVSAGKYIGDKRISNNLKYRVDEREPVELTMKPADEPYVFFNDLNSPFLKALETGKQTVLIQLKSWDYDRSTARFTLNGSTAAIQAVREACKNRKGW